MFCLNAARFDSDITLRVVLIHLALVAVAAASASCGQPPLTTPVRPPVIPGALHDVRVGSCAQLPRTIPTLRSGHECEDHVPEWTPRQPTVPLDPTATGEPRCLSEGGVIGRIVMSNSHCPGRILSFDELSQETSEDTELLDFTAMTLGNTLEGIPRNGPEDNCQGYPRTA